MAETGELPTRLRIASRVGGVGLTALLGACTMLGPNFTTPKSDVAASWTTQSGVRVSHERPGDADWWNTFDDATLDKLIELAYRQNLSLQQAGVNVLQARAQLGVAIGNEYPQKQGAEGRLRYYNRGGNDDSVLPSCCLTEECYCNCVVCSFWIDREGAASAAPSLSPADCPRFPRIRSFTFSARHCLTRRCKVLNWVLPA